MKIAIIEPFYSGSHKLWIDGIVMNSKHEVVVFSLKGKYWKWRMSGGAITLANQVNESEFLPELFLCSDMLDVALFKSLLKTNKSGVPICLYFHENQLTYPYKNESEREKNRHYAFINYTSALVADYILFNSRFHQEEFLESVYSFIRIFPDNNNLMSYEIIKAKSNVLLLGLDLTYSEGSISSRPTFLWNHRWEFDKNPEVFFGNLISLSEKGYDFDLNVIGEKYAKSPEIFNKAKTILDKHIINWGYVDSRSEYQKILMESNILLVTSNQDFFGISTMEAINSGCYPVLPNRLAFPELFPFEEYFYQEDEDIQNRLIATLDDKLFLKKNNMLIKHVQTFDWSIKILEYDSCFKLMNL